MSLLSSSSSSTISTTPKDDDISTAPKDDDISTKDDDISTATKDDDHFLIDLFNDFKDTISRAPHTIDNYFENIKIEIEVRIDSIVEELQKSNNATKEVLMEEKNMKMENIIEELQKSYKEAKEDRIEEYRRRECCLFEKIDSYKTCFVSDILLLLKTTTAQTIIDNWFKNINMEIDSVIDELEKSYKDAKDYRIEYRQKLKSWYFEELDSHKTFLVTDILNNTTRAHETIIDNCSKNIKFIIKIVIDQIALVLQESKNKDEVLIDEYLKRKSIIEAYQNRLIYWSERIDSYKPIFAKDIFDNIYNECQQFIKVTEVTSSLCVKTMNRLKREFSDMFSRVEFIPSESTVLIEELNHSNIDKMIGKFTCTFYKLHPYLKAENQQEKRFVGNLSKTLRPYLV